jgi:hypothetical protein
MLGYGFIELAQDINIAGTCDCGNETSGSIDCGELLEELKYVRFSISTVLHGLSK